MNRSDFHALLRERLYFVAAQSLTPVRWSSAKRAFETLRDAFDKVLDEHVVYGMRVGEMLEEESQP